jgi:hypothetical protein
LIPNSEVGMVSRMTNLFHRVARLSIANAKNSFKSRLRAPHAAASYPPGEAAVSAASVFC